MKCQKTEEPYGKRCQNKAEYYIVVYSHPNEEDTYKVCVCRKHMLEGFQIHGQKDVKDVVRQERRNKIRGVK